MRCVLAIFLLGIASALQASVPAGSIDEFITQEMPNAGTPGLAYAVVENGQIITGERGEKVVGRGDAVTPETPFALGSISKSFTAVAVMQLVEAGRVDLDAAIADYLDMFADSPGSGITIRQLLSHTSGYSTLQGNDTLMAPEKSADGLLRQAERIAGWTPAYQPGTRWAYSNANYYILGALIEALSGQDYASYIEAEILEPIGMTHSFVADGESYAMIARGHTPWFGMKRPVAESPTHRASAPVGGVIATARDTALYLAIMMNGEDDIISAQGKAMMMQPAGEASPFYGFGWYVDAVNGTVSHSGLTPGVETLAIMVPAERKGAVILVNASGGMGFGETAGLINGISARALGLDEAVPAAAGQWSRKALFATFVLLPVIFLLGMIVAWVKRDGLRAKAGVFGAFSLWFPLLMCFALAWVCVFLIPQLFGVTMGTLQRFSPDLALALIATAGTGVVWAVVRLGVYYSGKRVAL